MSRLDSFFVGFFATAVILGLLAFVGFVLGPALWEVLQAVHAYLGSSAWWWYVGLVICVLGGLNLALSEQ